MLKNKKLLWIILPIILLAFSLNVSAAYYKYTMESGTNFYVSTADKADALETENEKRQILDDLGFLLQHSKRDDSYPADETTGGTLGIFDNYYLKTEMDALSEMEAIWIKDVTDSDELAAALADYYLKTAIDSLSEVETIWSVDVTDSTELATALTDYYLKSAIDTLGEVETIYSADIVDTTELATALTDYYLKTAIDTQGEMETIWSVTLLNDITGEDFADLADIPAHPAAATKVLETTVDGYAWIDTPSGGGASQLSDLSDVGVTTPTDKYVLVADGDSWESRALVEADISDLGTYIEALVDDPAPELGEELDAGAHSIGFTVQTIEFSEGTATIDWGNSNKARITLSENTTLAFTNPANSGNYMLIIIQPAGANAYTITFPAGIYWANGTKVSVPTADNNRCIVSFAFDDEDGDKWYCQGTETFATDD